MFLSISMHWHQKKKIWVFLYSPSFSFPLQESMFIVIQPSWLFSDPLLPGCISHLLLQRIRCTWNHSCRCLRYKRQMGSIPCTSVLQNKRSWTGSSHNSGWVMGSRVPSWHGTVSSLWPDLLPWSLVHVYLVLHPCTPLQLFVFYSLWNAALSAAAVFRKLQVRH